jgi:4-hydroxybenzoate polyprenyltransferase
MKGPVVWVLLFLLLAVFLFVGTIIGERNGFFLMLTTIAILYGLYFLASAVDVVVRQRPSEETGPIDRGFIPMNFLVGSVIILGAIWAIVALIPSIENEMHPKPEPPIVYTG